MENYNPVLFQQLAPLVHVDDTRCDAAVRARLRASFSRASVSGSMWDNSIIRNRLQSQKFLVRFTAAPARAQAPPQAPPQASEHSALSPFNPASSIYPNGIILEEWFDKYTAAVPCAHVVVCLFPGKAAAEGSDPAGAEPAATLADLAAIKAAVAVKLIVLAVTPDGTGGAAAGGAAAAAKSLGLPFHLTSADDALVAAVLAHVKTAAGEFYPAVESRVRQRHKKYYSYPAAASVDTAVELTPQFLETRNAIKLGVLAQFHLAPDAALRHLAAAYDSLLAIVGAHYAARATRPHDAALYTHFRVLLDTLCFHQVRAHLAMENVAAAMRRHRLHLGAVAAACGAADGALPTANWRSVQVEWLAELMLLVPRLLQPQLAPFGLVLHDAAGAHAAVTRPAMLFVEAAAELCEAAAAAFALLPRYASAADVAHKRLELLAAAAGAAGAAADSPGAATDSPGAAADSPGAAYLSYISVLTAEQHVALGDFGAAAASYRALGSLGLVLQQLMVCHERSGDALGTLEAALAAAAHPDRAVRTARAMTGAFDVGRALVRVLALVVDASGTHATSLYHQCVVQLRLRPAVDLAKLERLLQTKVLLVVRRLEVDTSFGRVSLDGVEGEGAPAKGQFAAAVGAGGTVVQLRQEASEVGRCGVRLVAVEATLRWDGGSAAHAEVVRFDDAALPHHERLYTAGGCRQVRLNGVPPHVIEVAPVQPQVFLTAHLPTAIFMGERLRLAVEVLVQHKRGVDYGEFVVACDARVEGALPAVVRSSWDHLKDDEPMAVPPIGAHTRWLNVLIEAPPSADMGADKLAVVARLLPRSEAAAAPAELARYELKVMPTPLACTFRIAPRLGSMPNPFVDGESAASMPVATRVWVGSVRVVPHAWVEVVDVAVAIKLMSPEVSVEALGAGGEVRFTTRSKTGAHRNVVVSAEAAVRWRRVSEASEASEASKASKASDASEASKQSDASDASDASKPSKTVKVAETSEVPEAGGATGASEAPEAKTSGASVASNVASEADEAGETNETGSAIAEEAATSNAGDAGVCEASVANCATLRPPAWDVTLPLADPRVVVLPSMQRDTVLLRFVIENPTPRIFSFTTQMVADAAHPWTYVDALNLVPSVQPAFPVLPFLQHAIDFYAVPPPPAPAGVRLPHLRVFDVNYKVALPVLAATANVELRGGVLYWDGK